jgi:hypothetical protein
VKYTASGEDISVFSYGVRVLGDHKKGNKNVLFDQTKEEKRGEDRC